MAEYLSIRDIMPENGKTFCIRFRKRRRPTNADRIRAMTDEELARWIADDLIEPGYFNGDDAIIFVSIG